MARHTEPSSRATDKTVPPKQRREVSERGLIRNALKKRLKLDIPRPQSRSLKAEPKLEAESVSPLESLVPLEAKKVTSSNLKPKENSPISTSDAPTSKIDITTIPKVEKPASNPKPEHQKTSEKAVEVSAIGKSEQQKTNLRSSESKSGVKSKETKQQVVSDELAPQESIPQAKTSEKAVEVSAIGKSEQQKTSSRSSESKPGVKSKETKQQASSSISTKLNTSFYNTTKAFLATAILTCGVVLMAWFYNDKFFFLDDTENGAYGIWYKIGQSTLNHEWLKFSSSAWMAGNYTAEGQWGIWSPMFMLIGVLAVKIDDAYIFTALLKGFFMCLGATGIFMVAKSYKANNFWAMLVGVAGPIAGFTLFRDVTSWVTNLMIWAILPWIWWATRRFMYKTQNPFLPFLFGYMLVTIGYVQGTIILIVMYIALLIEALLAKQYKAISLMLLNGLVLGLVALVVYLPGILTADVSNRDSHIGNNGLLVSSIGSLFVAATPTQMPQVRTWGYQYNPMPYTYIAWFVPLFAFVDYGKVKTYLKEISAVITFTVISILLTIAPSDLGPLRFPIRFEPFVVFGVLVLFAIFISRSMAFLTTPRLALALGLVILGFYISWSQTPSEFAFHIGLNLVVLLGVALSYLVLHKSDTAPENFRIIPIATVMLLTTAAVLGSQLSFFNNKFLSGYTNLNAPRHFADYQKILPEAKNDIMVVGNPKWLSPNPYPETAASNNWYITGKKTHNLYSVVEYKNYNKDLCMGAHGETCYTLKDKLFEQDEATNMDLVDELQVDTIQILRPPNQFATDQDFIDDNQPPAGWSVVRANGKSVVWTRDNPVGPSGGIAWQSSGVNAQVVSSTEDSVSFKVNSIPSQGGDIGFSRLMWPGMQIQGGDDVGTFNEPTHGYLMTAHINPDQVGKTVTIKFTPPSWDIEFNAWKVAILIITLWTFGFYFIKATRLSWNKQSK
ncbi:MAG: hypothetical protein QM613_01825 [Micrococcaceae bacterium]